MENVEEIQQWGPLDETGRPIKERVGEDYKKFISAMTLLGYEFDSKELVAANYGAPTTRKRWYAIFRRDGREIVWPKETHYKDRKPMWKQCGDYIDWSDLGTSIFDRKKPLAEATQRRIANGIRKYIIENPHPYIVKNKDALAFMIQYHGEQKEGESRGQVLSDPIKTIDTSNRYGLVTAFITKFYKTGIGQGCDEPLHTITTSPGHFGLISAFLVKYYGTGCGQELASPLATITTKDRFGLVNVLLNIKGEKYIISDVFLRMLKPEELKVMQGFPNDYIIDRDYRWHKYPTSEQVKRIGNSVVPIMAKAIVEANCSYLKVGEREPNPMLFYDDKQLSFA
jgi:DNA (cytosine-5)-methyltransferase 1